MSKLARAGLLLFAALLLLAAFAPPLLAQEPGCRPLEVVASEAAEAGAAGATIHVLTGEETGRAMDLLDRKVGPFPGQERPSTLIIVRGPESSAIFLAEGIRVCFVLRPPPFFVDHLISVARGEPA